MGVADELPHTPTGVSVGEQARLLSAVGWLEEGELPPFPLSLSLAVGERAGVMGAGELVLPLTCCSTGEGYPCT